jgi:ankyrin repeat protein
MIIKTTHKYGSTALMFAAQSGKPEHVKLLVDAGADVNIQNQEGVKIFILQKESVILVS